ncbi:MAG: protease complex subunit PrcB family protein [Gemmataceae bacterium]
MMRQRTAQGGWAAWGVAGVLIMAAGGGAGGREEDGKPEKQDGKTLNIINSFSASGPMGFDQNRQLVGARVERVIRSQADMDKVLPLPTRLQIAQSKTPNIDFSRHMLIYVTAGIHNSGGFTVRVQKVTVSPDGQKATIYWQETPPGAIVTGAITHPGVVAIVEKFEGSVEFQQVAPPARLPQAPIPIRPLPPDGPKPR